MEQNTISGAIVDAAMKVHAVLGAGLLEHTYHVCLKHELTMRGMQVSSELALPIWYEGVSIDIGYRIDLLVEEKIIVEIKSVAQLTPLHSAQLLSYLKLSRKSIGLLINFNTPHLRDGIIRLIDSSSASSAVKFNSTS